MGNSLIKRLTRIPEGRYTVRVITRWLWRSWKGNRRQAAFNAAIGIFEVVVSLASVWALQQAIDIAAGYRTGSLFVAVAFMAFLILCDFGLNMSRIWIKNILGVKAQNRMQQRILDRLLRSEWRGRERYHSGDIVNRLEFDVGTVVKFLTETLPNTLSVVFMFIGAFLYLAVMDIVLAVITVAILPLFILFSRIYINHMRRYSHRVRKSDSRVQSILQETVQHRVLIKTLESSHFMVGRLDHQQSALRHHVRRRTKFSLLSNLALNTGFSIGYLVAFLWGALRLSRHTLSFGGMTAFLQLVNRIQLPARDITRLAPAFVNVITAAERLMELEEEPVEKQGKAIKLSSPCGIRLDDVSFHYPDGEEDVLNHLSFDFRPGSCTAIIGETGVGKTTLIRLILALMKPTDGHVTIYNDETSCEVSALTRCNFVYVPQGNTLLSGSIRDNLAMARSEASEEEMRQALTDACATFVFNMPHGLDASLTEVGGGLSEGQAQRIAIARALLRGGAVMIFDEATSALDPATERQLLKNVLGKKRHTVIFITHRMAVKDYCDCTLNIGED